MRNIEKAKFISADAEWDLICPSFKKSIKLKGEVKHATLDITALGVYTCYINGKRVGRDYMTPGWTEYRQRLEYQTYDVTDLLKSDTDIVIGTGHGWFASRIMGASKCASFKRAHYGDVPAARCALDIEYRSGERELIVTDDSWLAAKSELLQSQIYDGEIVDANIVPEYTKNVNICEYNTRLVPHDGEFVRAIERVAAKEVIHTPKGETVIDFGQDLTGFVEFEVTAKGGEVLSFLHGEVLDKDGNFYRDNYRGAKAELIYTAKPGKQTYGAKYTFYGFRYIKIVNWCEEVCPENFTAVVLHSVMKRTGFFECGHKKLSKLYENIIWGQRGNFLDIPTDCPQRDERAGWTGDAAVFCHTASLNYDTEKFFKKWLRDVKVTADSIGYVPHCIPTVHVVNKTSSSAVWGDVATIAPWDLYMAYGDKAFLKEMYPMMRDRVEYMHKAKGEEYLWQNGWHFGDWLGLDAPYGSYKGSTNDELIATAFFYHSTELLVKAARVLGKDKDAEKYSDMLPKIKAAFAKAYIKSGKLIGDTQTAYVLAIHLGLVDGELKENFGRRLVLLIKKAGGALTTGFVGTPYLLNALSDVGRDDIAYSLLLREKFPGWLFSVNMGATTVWEHWDGINEKGEMWSTAMNSFNHYAYGACASWMYHYIGGIKRLDGYPTYKHFEISPVTSEKLGYAKVRLITRSGEITSAWKYEDGGIRYTFEIPKGCTAKVKIGGVCEELGEGCYTRYSK